VHYHFNLDQLINDVYTWACDRFYDAPAGPRRVDDAGAARRDDRRRRSENEDDALVIAMHDIDLFRRGSAAMGPLLQALYDRQVALYFATLQLGVAQGTSTSPDPSSIWRRTSSRSRTPTSCTSSAATARGPRRARGSLGYARIVTGCAELSLRR
jgi:hypothetical protein